jgi:hypothetical protein
MMDHFRSYGTATGDAFWTQVVDASYGLVTTIETNFSASTGLLPDFVEKTDTSPAPAGADYLEDTTDGQYAYNACRVPWHLATDYVVSGDARAKTALSKINTWIKSKTGGTATSVKDGYKLNGTTTGTSNNFAFEAPFGPAAMISSSNQAWLDAIWSNVSGHTAADKSYYDDTLKMLNMIVMSGNWWQP